MANIGDSYSIIATDMQLIDSNNSKISYTSCKYDNTTLNSFNIYNHDAYRMQGTGFNIKFRFIGSNLYLYFWIYSDRCPSLKVIIDNSTPEYFGTNFNNSNASQLAYKKTGLDYKPHSVSISIGNTTNSYAVFDCIQIDKTGKLVIPTFLMQDGNNLDNTDGIGLINYSYLPYDVTKFNSYGMNDLSNINSTIINKIINQKYNIGLIK